MYFDQIKLTMHITLLFSNTGEVVGVKQHFFTLDTASNECGFELKLFLGKENKVAALHNELCLYRAVQNCCQIDHISLRLEQNRSLQSEFFSYFGDEKGRNLKLQNPCRL